MIFQWAGVYALPKNAVLDRAAEGWLALDVDSHDKDPNAPSGPPANYQSVGNTDRETCYFLKMYLRDYRAIDYIASRPEWDGKTLVVTGTSMGGQQSLCVAGLHPKMTHVIVNVPAGCDFCGPLHGRASGYPNWPSNNPAIMQTAPYFDAVNFAGRIKATALVAMGFIDTIAPPVGIWAAFNQIPGPKEAAPMFDSHHNNLATRQQQLPFTSRSTQWLNTLVQGQPVQPDEDKVRPGPSVTPAAAGSAPAPGQGRGPGGPAPADRPVARTDQNSQIAHTQLLEKAKKGGIDVYFEGDSITRRWGATDYPQFLANWKQNFFGWNAGGFRLGRRQHAEYPLASRKRGIGQRPSEGHRPPGRHEQRRQCPLPRRYRSPHRGRDQRPQGHCGPVPPESPRGDDRPDGPHAAERQPRQSDGRHARDRQDQREPRQARRWQEIRYVNINDKLADADGKLYDGMTVDRLHLSLKGYQIWADALKPILTELLGPPAQDDHAPPPTGDPSAKPKPPATK